MAGQISKKRLTVEKGQINERKHEDVPRLPECKAGVQALMTLLDMAERELTHITGEY